MSTLSLDNTGKKSFKYVLSFIYFYLLIICMCVCVFLLTYTALVPALNAKSR